MSQYVNYSHEISKFEKFTKTSSGNLILKLTRDEIEGQKVFLILFGQCLEIIQPSFAICASFSGYFKHWRISFCDSSNNRILSSDLVTDKFVL